MSNEKDIEGFPQTFGEYTLVRPLSSGGMAKVYVARRSGVLEREVALKRMRRDIVGDADDSFRAMFLDETKITAQLSHANIVQCYDCGEVQGECFMAMELVDGYDLGGVIRRARETETRLPPEFVAYCTAAVARGLSYAHKREVNGKPLGIVHRDVSPRNILISRDGAVKIADFGIAKAEDRASKTESGVLKGKYAYMAPEQVLASAIDHRADIFSLATVAYELASLCKLFTGEGDFSTLSKVQDVALPDDYSATLEGYPELEEILNGALKREPEDRYSDAAQLAKRLEAITMTDDGLYGAEEAAACLAELFAAGDEQTDDKAEEQPAAAPAVAPVAAVPKTETQTNPTINLSPKDIVADPEEPEGRAPAPAEVAAKPEEVAPAEEPASENLLAFLDAPNAPPSSSNAEKVEADASSRPAAPVTPEQERPVSNTDDDNLLAFLDKKEAPPPETAEQQDASLLRWKVGNDSESSKASEPPSPPPAATATESPKKKSKHKLLEIAAAAAVAGLLLFFFVFDGSFFGSDEIGQAKDDMRGEFPELQFKSHNDKPPSPGEVGYLFREQAKRQQQKSNEIAEAPRKALTVANERQLPKGRREQPRRPRRKGGKGRAHPAPTAGPSHTESTASAQPKFFYAEGGEADVVGGAAETAEPAGAAPKEKKTLDLPVLTKIPVSLSIGISSTRRDKVLARVTKAVKGRSGEVLIPKGAVVGGAATGRDKQRIYCKFEWVKIKGERFPIAGQASTGTRKSRYGLPAVVREATSEERQSAEFAKGGLQVLRDVAVAGAGGLGRNLSTLGDGAVREGKAAQDVDDGLVLTVAAGKTFNVIIVE